MWKIKKKDFWQKLADTICVRKGEKTRIFVHTICFGQKIFLAQNSVNQKKTIKISGFSRNCPKAKMTPFFGKRCFLTWVKKWVLLTVFFEKLCFPENTIFIVFLAKHSFSKTKTVCWKHRKFMKNSGLFLSMANGVFWVWFFWGFNIKKVCFWCVWHCFKSVIKMLVFFPVFLGFSGVAYYCSSGFGCFRCFCVSCVCFSLLCCFCFCFVCFVIWFCGCFVFCFVFLEFFFVFFCFVFLEGLRVRWGGPKGHLTWP